jgi:hypothetical protein
MIGVVEQQARVVGVLRSETDGVLLCEGASESRVDRVGLFSDLHGAALLRIRASTRPVTSN